MRHTALERLQVWIYLGAIAFGLGLGSVSGDAARQLEAGLWPLLGILLFATFTQVPLIHLPDAFRDRRFMGAVLGGNFLIVPLVVWGLLAFLPDDPAIRLGVLLVLLVPCTDWYITFTHLGGGDTQRAIAVSPVNLLLQVVLLPVYLWIFMGLSCVEIFLSGQIVMVSVTLILLPLAGAWLLERWAQGQPVRGALIERLGWLPVPLLALVVFLIAASQVQGAIEALPILGMVGGVFVAYLVAAVAIGLGLARLASLPTGSAQSLIYSLGTRNSFVVLPLALALAPEWQAATMVIVLQSLVELFGMLVFLRVVPLLVKHRA